MKGKKLISLLCAGAMTASLLAGCGSSSESADSSAASESEKAQKRRRKQIRQIALLLMETP